MRLDPATQARVIADSVDLRNPDWRTCLAVDVAAALGGTRIDPLPDGHPAGMPAGAPGDRDHTPLPARASEHHVSETTSNKITAFRIVTTHGEYRATVDERDADGMDGGAMAEEFGEAIIPDGHNQKFKLKADGIGWVAINPRYVVAIEVIEEQP